MADALAAHPAHQESLTRLRGTGVRFGGPYAGEPQEGGGRPDFARERALDLPAGPWVRSGQRQPTVGPASVPPVYRAWPCGIQ